MDLFNRIYDYPNRLDLFFFTKNSNQPQFIPSVSYWKYQLLCACILSVGAGPLLVSYLGCFCTSSCYQIGQLPLLLYPLPVSEFRTSQEVERYVLKFSSLSSQHEDAYTIYGRSFVLSKWQNRRWSPHGGRTLDKVVVRPLQAEQLTSSKDEITTSWMPLNVQLKYFQLFSLQTDVVALFFASVVCLGRRYAPHTFVLDFTDEFFKVPSPFQKRVHFWTLSAAELARQVLASC